MSNGNDCGPRLVVRLLVTDIGPWAPNVVPGANRGSMVETSTVANKPSSTIVALSTNTLSMKPSPTFTA